MFSVSPLVFPQIRTVAKEGLSISRGAFEGLANLASLDLGNTAVRFGEKGSLCAMPNLLNLNRREGGVGIKKALIS